MSAAPRNHERESKPIVIAVITAALLFGSTSLYNDTGQPNPTAYSGWGNTLSTIARWLTVPFQSPSPADIRILLLPLAAAAGAFWLSIRGVATGALSDLRRAGSALGLHAILCATLLAWCVVSAHMTDSSDFAMGWIVESAAGCAVSLVLAMSVPRRFIGTVVDLVLSAAAVVFALSLWQRSVLGISFVQWPIGALTPAAALAAMISATAVTRLATNMMPRRNTGTEQTSTETRYAGWRSLAITLTTAILAIAVCMFAMRRAAILGALLGLAVPMFLVIWSRIKSRRSRIVAVLGLISLSAVTGIWTLQQINSTKRSVSGSFRYRQEYWRLCEQSIRAHPLFGIGPDAFARQATPRMAQLHDLMPHVFAGNFDPEAHNEWLQAVTELGIPGGLLYLLIPISLLARALLSRRVAWVSDSCEWIERIPLAAGLIAVLVTEFAGTSLRGHILPAWYWCWIGLLLAACRSPQAASANSTQQPTSLSTPKSAAPRNAVSVSVRLTALLIAGWFSVECASESMRLHAHARGIEQLRRGNYEAAYSEFETAQGRWRIQPFLMVRGDRAMAATLAAENASNAGAREAWVVRAVDHWGLLTRRFGGMLAHDYQYAEALLMAGRADGAAAAILNALRNVNAYDSRLNLLAARRVAASPAEQVERLVRAARNTLIDNDWWPLLNSALLEPSVSRNWTQSVSAARDSLHRWRDSSVDAEAEDATPEILRLESLRLRSQGHEPESIELLTEAASAQMLLRSTDFRRASDAEWSPLYHILRMEYESAPQNAATLLDRVREMETIAALGYGHARLQNAGTQRDVVGVGILPDFGQPQHAAMWNLAARIHLAAGDFESVPLCAVLSLPRDRQSADSAPQAMRRVAQQLVRDFANAPNELRPEYWSRILEMAQNR